MCICDQSKVGRDNDLGFQLAQEAPGDAEIAAQFPIGAAVGAFSDIRDDGNRRPSHLIGQPEMLPDGEGLRDSVDRTGKQARPLPSQQLPKVSHCSRLPIRCLSAVS